MRNAASIIRWAAVVKSQRSEWIHPFTIRSTRADARQAYVALHAPHHQAAALRIVRFARVVVSLAEPKGEA